MPRLVQVRGASGSGKTSLVRGIMTDLDAQAQTLGQSHLHFRLKSKIAPPERRKPTSLYWPHANLAVIGHYDVGCGGCDTIKSRSLPYDLARQALDTGANVLMEGLFLSVEFHRTVALADDGYDRHDVFMDVPLGFCVDSVNKRRAAEGKEPKEQKQMEAFHRRIMQTYKRLADVILPWEDTLHVYCENDPDFTRTLAGDHVRALLNLPGGDFSNPDRDVQ